MALYHSVKGPATYTIVGNPTIQDGIVSNFNAQNQITISTPKICTTVLKVTTSQDVNTRQSLCSSTRLLDINIIDGYFSVWKYSNPAELQNIVIAQPNTTYWIKSEVDGVNKIYSYSLDGKNYTTVATVADAFGEENNTLWLGNHYSIKTYPFLGSIDLNETYIIANGQPWFGVCPIEVKKHQLMGPVGYTKVGSPTITDGIASGFSSSDYLKTTLAIPSNTNTYKLHTEFTTGGANPSSKAVIVGTSEDLYGSWGFILDQNGVLFANVYLTNADDLSRSYFYEFSTGVTVLANQKYYAELYYSHEDKNIISKVSTDGANWTTQTVAVYNNSIPGAGNRVIGFGKGQEGVFNGSIDFNNTYIKVNDEMWFYQPAPTKYIIREDKDTHEQKLVFADQGLYLAGPVNYSVVGSPTIVDGVMSNFSASNYAQLNSTYTATNTKNCEFYVRFKTPSTISGSFNPVLYGHDVGYFGISTYSNAVFVVRMGSDNGVNLFFSDIYPSSGDIQPDTWYRVKITGNNGSWKAEVFDDNGNSLGSDTKDWSATSLSVDYTIKLQCTNNDNSASGSIDLNSTYIKVDGQLWFYGKNYASANIAPVPGSYTFGNTTTPYIGYVDMRTQQYHQAPAGTVLVSPDGKATYDDYVIEDNKLVAVNPNIYLESDGNQYIDTNIYPNSNYTLEANILPIYNSSQYNNLIIDNAWNGQEDGRIGFMYRDNDISDESAGCIFYNYYPSTTSSWTTYQFNQKFTLKTGKDGTNTYFYVNGILDLTQPIEPKVTSITPILFWNSNSLGRIYNVKVYDDNKQLVGNFVPVPAGLVIGNYTVPSNGMFDMVSQQFYPNAGTGEFTIGRDE